MKMIQKRRLTIPRETIRILDSTSLGGAAGGVVGSTVAPHCACWPDPPARVG